MEIECICRPPPVCYPSGGSRNEIEIEEDGSAEVDAGIGDAYMEG